MNWLTDEGFIEHRGHSVWWGVSGPQQVTGSPPVLTIHGGPGMPHDCLEPLAALGADRQVYFYDQYGCGRSDRATDSNEYDIDLFLEEVAAIREQLGLDRVHMYAHSYGGPVLLEYMLRHKPAGVLSLTLSNTFPSIQKLHDGWNARLAELTDPASLEEFVTRFVFPGPPPEPVVQAQANSGAEVYQRMHGSSWFQPDGQWSSWDVAGELPQIDVPTLVIGGTRDQCVPALAEELAAGISGSELVVLDAAHLPFFEVREVYLRLLREFLRRVDLDHSTGSSNSASRARTEVVPRGVAGEDRPDSFPG